MHMFYFMQDLVEVILVLQQCGRYPATAASATPGGDSVGRYLAQYASLLATQGALANALQYLSSNTAIDPKVGLTNRLLCLIVYCRDIFVC